MVLESQSVKMDADPQTVFNMLINDLPVNTILNLPDNSELVDGVQQRLNAVLAARVNLGFGVLGTWTTRKDKPIYQLIKLPRPLMMFCLIAIFGDSAEATARSGMAKADWSEFLRMADQAPGGKMEIEYRGKKYNYPQWVVFLVGLEY